MSCPSMFRLPPSATDSVVQMFRESGLHAETVNRSFSEEQDKDRQTVICRQGHASVEVTIVPDESDGGRLVLLSADLSGFTWWNFLAKWVMSIALIRQD